MTLPNPIGMPNGLTLRFQYDERESPYLAELAKDPATPVDLLRAGAGPYDVALKLRQVPSHAISEWLRLMAAQSVAEQVSGESSVIGLPDLDRFLAESKGRASAIVTVAEIATFSHESDPSGSGDGNDFEIEDLRDPLLRSIHCLHQFGRAYRIGTHTPMPAPTYMRLPSQILLGTCELDRSSTPVIHGWSRLSHDHRSDSLPPMPTPREIGQWLESVQLLAAGDPMALVQERLLEAQRLATMEGDFGASVVEAALAAETLLDGVLGLLLWERDGGAPNSDGDISSAVSTLSRPLRARLRSEYHPLIGGSWDMQSSEPLRDWDRHVAFVRGRVVHRGYRPRGDEAADALNAVYQLVEFVRDRVATKARQFPRTALMIVTDSGLVERNAWQRIRAFSEDAARQEPPWRDNYGAWRDRVDRAIARE